MKYKYFYFVVFFLFVVNLSAQDSVTINEYGTYIVKNKNAKKLPVTEHLSSVRFWEHYLLFQADDNKGCYIYNIQNDVLSLRIEDFYIYPIKKYQNKLYIRGRSYRTKYIDNRRHDRSEIRDYELNAITLDVISITGPEIKEHFSSDSGLSIQTESEKLEEHIIRYKGRNYYLDVLYGNNIDLTYGKWIGEYAAGGLSNLFVVFIENIENYK
jgi:hypothetical protein